MIWLNDFGYFTGQVQAHTYSIARWVEDTWELRLRENARDGIWPDMLAWAELMREEPL